MESYKQKKIDYYPRDASDILMEMEMAQGKGKKYILLYDDEFYNLIDETEKQAYEKGCKDTDDKYGDYANEMNKLLFKAEKETRKQAQSEMREEIDKMIADEMIICHKENQPTSRLTSLANKVSNYLNKIK